MKQNILPKTRVSNPFSKLLRPVFENKWIRTALGGGFAMTTLASGLILLPADSATVLASYPIIDTETVLETKKSMVVVIPDLTGVSQGFYLGHPGMDITAPLGSKIFPLKSGLVSRIDNAKWNYGRAVWIDHGNGMTTLYAHMGKIYVEEGEMVTTEQAIGEVGLTGKTTGPHLHIEVHKNEASVNPKPYISLKKD